MKLKTVPAFLLFFLLLVQVCQSQTFISGSQGFEANYLPGSPSSSCLTFLGPTSGGYYFTGGNVLNSSMDATHPLTIQSKATINSSVTEAPAYFDFLYTKGVGPAAQCVSMKQEYDNVNGSSYFIDLSGNAKVTLVAKSDVPNTELVLYLAYSISAGGYPSQSSYIQGLTKSVTLSTTMTAYPLDFSDWVNKDKVNMFGIYIGTANATVSIEKMSIGSQFWSAFANHIKGNIYDDTNNDCVKQVGETGLPNTIVEAMDGNKTYWGYSNADGDYDIAVDSGTINYAVTPHVNNRNANLLKNLCSPGRLVAASGSGQDFCCTDFGFKVTHCTLLSVNINSDRKRRCFRSNTYVYYTNYGTTVAAAPVIKVVYPKFTVPVSSIPAWTSKIGDTLIYQLTNLAGGGSGVISLVDSVICGREDIRGLSQCIEAIISPKSLCIANEPSWDGSSVAIAPYCENGVARFVVQNTGQDMSGSAAYRLYSNDTLVFQSTFQLISGNTFQVRYPANGAVIRLEADQRPAHPGRSQPRAFVEGCGTTTAAQTSVATESLVLSVPQDDLDEEVSISCITIVDSFDPNDKASLPVGITDDHLVKAGTQLKYTIRFQNTGTDVAYKIVVVDTLDVNLDLATFTESSSSHPYVLKVSNEVDKTILTYTFNNINLKDSTTSEPESHGFVSFYINSKEDLVDGNTIHNKADIFFDYNSAITTNVVDHTIGTYVPTDLSKGNKVEVTTGLFESNASTITQRVTVYPNPASDVIQVKLQQQITDAQLNILDLSGHEVYSGTLKGEITSVSLALPAGMYLYKVQSNGEFVGVGKLLVK